MPDEQGNRSTAAPYDVEQPGEHRIVWQELVADPIWATKAVGLHENQRCAPWEYTAESHTEHTADYRNHATQSIAADKCSTCTGGLVEREIMVPGGVTLCAVCSGVTGLQGYVKISGCVLKMTCPPMQSTDAPQWQNTLCD